MEPLKSGSRIGPYELTAPIGAGGMGEVWKARDTRLDRTVAIKFSQSAFTHRFQLEARSIAALNHPNVATLYDVGENFLVMELVDGEPIRPPNDTRKLLDIAVQIADGLAAAHAAGIIHRDLKPGNILLTKSGRIKILDFGLAKQTAPAKPANDATQTMAAITEPGTIAGTAAYMSPEQARGQALDTRSDQFSFGLVLYELATGKRAFQKSSTPETLAAIIREDPDPLPASLPAPLRWLIERCLAKDPESRYDTTRGLFLELRTIRERITESVAAAASPIGKPSRRIALWTVAAAMLAGAAGIGWVVAVKRSAPPPQLKYTPFAADSCKESQPSWSPNGLSLAYVCEVDGINQVFTRAIDAAVPAQITKGKTAAARPFWSPDATRIYFEQDQDIYFTGATGGSPQLFLKNAIYPSLSPDGKRLAFTRHQNQSATFWIANGDGTGEKPFRVKGFPETVRTAVSRFSPDGKRLAVVTVAADLEEGTRELWIIPSDGSDPFKTPVWLRQYSPGLGPFSWHGNDKLVFSMRSAEAKEAEPHLVSVDVVSGVQRPLTAGPLSEVAPAVSPDGKRIAVTIQNGDADIYEFQLDSGKGKALLAGPRRESDAIWAPSGREFAFIGEVNGLGRIWLRSEDGTSRPLILSGPEIENLRRLTFSPDGQRLALDSYGDPHRAFLVSTSGGVPIAIDPASMDSHGATFSPDGAWLAYTRYKDKTGKLTKVATGGGGQPVDLVGTNQAPGFPIAWSPAGDCIAFSVGQELRVISPDGKQTRTLSKTGFRAWTFQRDGSHIYGLRRGKDRRWELGSIHVATGIERSLVALDLPPGVDVGVMSLHPDGKRFLTSINKTTSDLWIIDGVPPN